MSSTTELQTWFTGTPTGGPNGDGRYPLTYKNGTVYLVYCPAAQALNPALAEQPIEVFANAAASSASTASTAASDANTAKLAAQTSAANAAASETNALASKNAAATSATNASTSATNAANSATAANTSATNAATSATNAANSLAAFNSGAYVKTDGSTPITAQQSFNHTESLKIGLSTVSYRTHLGGNANSWWGTNTHYTGAAWVVDDATQPAWVQMLHIANNRVEWRYTPAGGAQTTIGFLSATTLQLEQHNLYLKGQTTENRSIQVGDGRTGDGTSFIDLIGDATYTDYGTRLQRQAGANGNTALYHRGTGSLVLDAQDANGTISIRQQGLSRMAFAADGKVTFPVAGAVGGLANGVAINGPTASGRRMRIMADGVDHWQFGGDSSNNFVINRYDDAGVSLGTPLWINRTSGDTTIANSLTVTTGITSNGGITSTSGTIRSTNGALDSRATAAGNAQIWLTDDTGLSQGLLYWGRSDDSLRLRRYNAAGNAAESEISITAAQILLTPGGSGAVVTSNDLSVGNDLTVTGGDVFLKALAAANCNYWLRDESNLSQGALYWNRSDDTVRLRRYDAAGTGVEGEVIISSANVNVTTAGNVVINGNGAWHAGNFTPSSKQDVTANLTAWNALATSAKQDASANLSSWSALAPAAKQDALGFTPVNKAGDTMTGALTTQGVLVQRSAGMGYTVHNAGTATLPGYLSFHTTDDVRRMFIGWGNGTRNVIYGDNGWGVLFDGASGADVKFAIPINGDGNPGNAEGANALRLSGSYGGGIAMVDGTQYARFHTDTTTQNKLRLSFGNTGSGSTIRHTFYANGDIEARDFMASRGDGSGAIFLNAAKDRYLYYDGSQYFMPGANLNIGGAFYPGNSAGAYLRGNGSGLETQGALYMVGSNYQIAANSAAWIRQPRIFVQSTDPGAQAADGDIWIQI